MSSDAERVVDLYRRHAAAWDGERGRGLAERAWLDRFLALAPAGVELLDLGCGSGEPIARYLLERGYAVTGVDGADTMVALCRERFPKQAWLCADMRGLSLGREFGGVLAWDSFFHLDAEDQRRMFAVFRLHCRAGGPLMFTSGPAAGEAVGSYRGEPLYHASLAPDEYRALLGAHGFEVVAHAAEDPACGGHTVWLARRG